MHEDIEKRLKIAAGSAPDNGTFDEVWLRATQIQRRRAGIFSTVAASLSLVVVMSASALTSSTDLRDRGVGTPVGFSGTESPTPETVMVPDVTGLAVPLAEEILRDAGLEPIVVTDTNVQAVEVKLDCQPFAGKDKERRRGVEMDIRCFVHSEVLIQLPVAGTNVPVGSEVRIDASGGPNDVIFEKRRELRSEHKQIERRLRKETMRALSKARSTHDD
jgi:hypothetical protein